MSNQIHFDVIIINYNTRQLTCDCIESLLKNDISSSNIIVVDNNSSDDSVAYISEHYKGVKVICNDRNFGYAKAINIGVSNSNANHYIISNSDIIYPSGSIRKLISSFNELRNPGVVAPQFINSDGSYQDSFSYFPSFKLGLLEMTYGIKLIHKLHNNQFQKQSGNMKPLIVDYPVGAVMLFSKILFDELDGFDESYFFYTEETDFCKRASDMGYINYVVRGVKVKHLVGGTRESINLNHIPLLVYTKRLYMIKHLSKIESSFYQTTQIVKFIMNFIFSFTLGTILSDNITNNGLRRRSKEFLHNWTINFFDLQNNVQQKYGT